MLMNVKLTKPSIGLGAANEDAIVRMKGHEGLFVGLPINILFYSVKSRKINKQWQHFELKAIPTLRGVRLLQPKPTRA